MSLSRYVWLLFAVGHVITVICGACYLLPRWDQGRSQHLWRWYAAMSGGDSSFGFFAPEVGGMHRARFMLETDDGSTTWDTFARAGNSEAWLRQTGIIEAAFMSGKAFDEPNWRRRLVQSWATAMFNRHPHAVSLTIVVESYDIPSDAELRLGKKPSWQVVYQAQFQRHEHDLERGKSK